MRTSVLRLAAALALGALASACSDSTGSDRLSGTYVLASIDGDAGLVIGEARKPDGSRDVYRVAGDTVRFISDVRLQRTVIHERVEFAPNGAEVGLPLVGGNSCTAEYTRRGDELSLTYPSSNNGSVIQPSCPLPPETFRIEGNTLVRTAMIGLVCTGTAVCTEPHNAEFVYTRR